MVSKKLTELTELDGWLIFVMGFFIYSGIAFDWWSPFIEVLLIIIAWVAVIIRVVWELVT